MNFTSINIQGNIVSSEILEKIRNEDTKYQQPADFGLDRKTTVRDEIGIAWAAARAHYTAFKMRIDRLKEGDSGTSLTRNSWMVPLLRELGYDAVGTAAYIHPDNQKSYAISHKAANLGGFPIHIMGVNDDLDRRRESGGPRLSPHALVQEYLNNTNHTYALVSNGRYLRLLRDATRLVRLSYLEVDLQKMMEEELYADFAIVFRLLHATRMPKDIDSTAESYIDYYHEESLASGSRIREKLSGAVEDSVKLLANGFLHHLANAALRQRVQSGSLSAADFYLQQLRLIYRFLFLVVTEERNLVYPATKDEVLLRKKKIYYEWYSIERLRRLAGKVHYIDGRKHDLWEGLKATFLIFEQGKYGEKLGIKPLGSGLFASDALGDLPELHLDNKTLLTVLQKLTYFENSQLQQTRVNYGDLDVEEFGSVYEGLLEYDAKITDVNGVPVFGFVKGTGRSSSGSHYTPEELVKPLIKHSLDYLIADKLKEADPETALLSLRVADVACGSGHILLSAARRIAFELACVRETKATGGRDKVEQPSPSFVRHALRLVIRHCIYGVDKNPLAVELCKVALWLESHNPGEPLGFIDHHIKCGDAIVGLAHREELEKGIPDEAFKTLPGDDKDIAKAWLNKNKEDHKRLDKETKNKESIQLSTDYTDEITQQVKEALAAYTGIINLPERTPEEIAAKARAYKKFHDNKGQQYLEALANAQVAQFFIPKILEHKDKLLKHGDYMQMLKGYKGWQGQQTSYANVVAQERRFFHWFLEFPEVFNRGGFDCIMGNPPFLGGKKLSGNFSDAFLEFIKYEFTPIGAVDLVAYFFRRIFTITKKSGFLSLISTNTIAQGDTREDGLEVIVKQGGTINHAIKSMRWPGKAAVEVALVTITGSSWEGPYFLGEKRVKTITPYLDDAETVGTPFALTLNENKSFIGSYVLGKGFILETQAAKALIKNNPLNSSVVFPYLIGDDLNNNPDQSASRWVINFFDWTEDQAKEYPDCYGIIERLVKPERQRWDKDVDGNVIEGKYALRKPLPQKWWIYADKRPALYKTIASLDRIVVINRHTKYIQACFVSTNAVYSDATVVLVLSGFDEFAVFSSNFHTEWSWKNSGTMGSSTLRFSPSDCFESFPFPRNLPTQLKQQIAQIGKNYHDFRKRLMLSIQKGLTDTYNLFHSRHLLLTNVIEDNLDDKIFEKKYGKDATQLRKHLAKTEGAGTYNEAVQDILKLRELHIEMDNAVLEAYGWQDIALKHDFYEVDYLPENDRVRYTIHPDARKEVLKRLLELNHKIHEEEVRAGLWEKKSGTSNAMSGVTKGNGKARIKKGQNVERLKEIKELEFINADSTKEKHFFEKAISKIRELENLGENWDEEGGEAIDVDKINKAITFCSVQFSQNSVFPSFVAPTVNSGVLIEYSNRKTRIDIRFESNEPHMAVFNSGILLYSGNFDKNVFCDNLK